MAIPQQTIDQILDRTDLVDLVGKYVKLKKSGRSYSGCCPFHQEKTPSFHVYRDKQYYHCFGCQANGNAIRFLMELESRPFLDVIQQLANQTGIDLPKHEQDNKRTRYKRQTSPSSAPTPSVPHDVMGEIVDVPDWQISDFPPEPFVSEDVFFSLPAEQQQEGNLYDLLEWVTQFYQQQLQHSAQAQAYFKQRGLTDETIQHWRLGYAPEGWQHLQQAFPQEFEGLKQVGLVRVSEQGRSFSLLRDRVIFPIRDVKGRIVGFGGRALNDDIKPKYINSPDSDIFHKNQLLYGLYEGAKQKAQHWLMVEGYMDVIALHQNGIYGAVATLGTASNAEHLQQLFKRNSRLTLAFDGDQAGQKAVRRTLEIALPLLNDGRELQFFVLPSEHDPDSLIRREGVEYFQQLWQKSPLLSDFLFSLLSQQHDISTPEGKSLVMGELKQLTELLPKQGSFRYLLQQFFREKLGLGWRFQPKSNQDASLSFQINTRIEDSVIALLIQSPALYLHFEPLRALISENELLAEILSIFDQVYEQLPDESLAQTYYMLGACADYQGQLNQIMQQQPHDLKESAEHFDRLAQEYALLLQRKYLQEKMKHCRSLSESKHLRQQFNDVMTQLAQRMA